MLLEQLTRSILIENTSALAIASRCAVIEANANYFKLHFATETLLLHNSSKLLVTEHRILSAKGHRAKKKGFIS
jgi:hypothetical protein